MRRGRRLGVDVGSVRVGVAVCDPDGLVATPYETVAAGDGAQPRIAELVAEVEAVEVVVGLPVSLNGRESHAAGLAREFATTLAQRLQVPVRLFDERFSTTAADTLMRQGGRSGKSRRKVIDQAAAAMILQGCLDAERARGTAPGETL